MSPLLLEGLESVAPQFDLPPRGSERGLRPRGSELTELLAGELQDLARRAVQESQACRIRREHRALHPTELRRRRLVRRETELEEIAEAWRAFAVIPSGFFEVPNGEIIASG